MSFAHSWVHHPLSAPLSIVLFLPFQSATTSPACFQLPHIPCAAESMQESDSIWGDSAGSRLQLSPCLAQSCSINAIKSYSFSCNHKWLGTGNPSHLPILLAPACTPMQGSFPPAPSRARAGKSPLPTAGCPVPGLGSSRDPQVFGTCCLPPLPAAAWPALLSLLAAGSSRWKAICLTWCERDFIGVRTLDDRGREDWNELLPSFWCKMSADTLL